MCKQAPVDCTSSIIEIMYSQIDNVQTGSCRWYKFNHRDHVQQIDHVQTGSCILYKGCEGAVGWMGHAGKGHGRVGQALGGGCEEAGTRRWKIVKNYFPKPRGFGK